VVFAWLVHESGILTAGATPGHTATALAALTGIVKAKAAESGTALFFRGVLCNFLVCLAVWMAARTRSDGAKLALIFWCLLAFVGSGFEHVAANMTVYSLGMFEHVKAATATALEPARFGTGTAAYPTVRAKSATVREPPASVAATWKSHRPAVNRFWV
jgi:nitrite transporter